jgi:hypothetical protein
MDIPTSSATSRTVSRQFSWMFFTLAGSEVEGQPDPSSLSAEVSNSETSEPSVIRHLTQGIIAISFTQHVVDICSCFPTLKENFNTYSLLLYRLHTTCNKTTTHSITKPVIKTERNV